MEKAEAARKAEDWETEALALREAVDVLSTRPASAELAESQTACTRAMIEAGGYAESYRVWKEMAAKNPEAAAETSKMIERARKLMLRQADELTLQVDIDLKAGRPAAALCTAKASLELLAQAGADQEQVAAAKSALARAETSSSKSAKTPISPKTPAAATAGSSPASVKTDQKPASATTP